MSFINCKNREGNEYNMCVYPHQRKSLHSLLLKKQKTEGKRWKIWCKTQERWQILIGQLAVYKRCKPLFLIYFKQKLKSLFVIRLTSDVKRLTRSSLNSSSDLLVLAPTLIFLRLRPETEKKD